MAKYYFIDESGDAEFFGKRGIKLWEQNGWQPFLIMGLLETENRKQLRKDVESFHEDILKDPLYEGIHSLETGRHFFHARGDHPEIRSAFFQFLKKREDVTCYFVIAKKNPHQFVDEFDKSATKFYFHLIKRLLELPKFNKAENHHFYLSRRNKTTTEHFDDVLKNALQQEMSEEQLNYQAEIVKSSEYPELCVIDYLLWALQRYLIKGEKRFLKAIEDKVILLTQLEDLSLDIKGFCCTIKEFYIK